MSFVLLLFAIPAALPASTVTPVTLKEMTARAHRIAIGRIDRITSARDEATGRIVSRVDMTETRSVSGSAPASFTFQMVGGTAAGIRQWIAGFPAFETGDEIILFLADQTNTPFGPTIGLWQGVFFVQKDASGSDVVLTHDRKPISEIRGDNIMLRDVAAGSAVVRAGQPAALSLPLDSFVEKVRGWRMASQAAAR